MKSTVYYTKPKTNFGYSLLHKLEKLWEKAEANKIIRKNDLVGIKIHFGEPGNLAYLRPPFARKVVELVQRVEAKAFLTDSNTLYFGGRSNSVDHLLSAASNGYTIATVGVPITIADGLRGLSYEKLPIYGGEYCKDAKFGRDLVDAHALVVLSHFKGHIAGGFGGAIKNLAMGGASRAGKQELHADSVAEIDPNLCVGCQQCIGYCAVQAIYLENNKAKIDQGKCQGCGECIPVCRQNAINPRFEAANERMQEKMAEYMKAIVDQKKGKIFYINVLIDISPACDCFDHNSIPICEDLGIMASYDPVAIDQASFDLVNKAVGKEDIFLEVTGVDSSFTLKHGEKIGLGSRLYELVEVG